jgi:glutamate dehydrogenase
MNDTFQAFSSSQVSSIQKCLPQEDLVHLTSIRLPGSSHVGVTLSDFLNHFFSRNSGDSAATKQATEIAMTVSSALKCLAKLKNQQDRLVIDIVPLEGATQLFIALDDCPFIISTIAERLSDSEAAVTGFVHPVLVHEDSVVALSLIELDGELKSDSPLIDQLFKSLTTLKQVVKDFDAMKSSVLSFSNQLTPTLLPSEFGDVDASEIQGLLEWLVDGSFFILGTKRFTSSSASSESELGLWLVPGAYSDAVGAEIAEDVASLSSQSLSFSMRKLRSFSTVHRPAVLLHILVQPPQGAATLSLVGYLTSKAWTRECQDIPVLRQKVSRLLQEEAVIPNSHDYKYMVEIVDNMPTDEALACTSQQLQLLIHLSLGVFSREVTRSLTYVDNLNRRALTMVVFPPERYSAAARAVIQECIEGNFDSVRGSSEVHIDSSKRQQFRLYVSTPLPREVAPKFLSEKLSEIISQATLTWQEKIFERLESIGTDPWTIYPADGFSAEYQASVTIEEAIEDASIIQKLSPESPVAVWLSPSMNSPQRGVISIFSLRPELSISKAIPVLENVGFEVLTAHSYECKTLVSTVNILKLESRPYDGSSLDAEAFNISVAPGLSSVLRGTSHNDPLNSLMRSSSLEIREIALLRSYCAHLWQVHKISTKRTMWEALANAPRVARQLWQIFDVKFNPALTLTIDQRITRVAEEEGKFAEHLRSVSDITHDRVLKALLSLIRATVRTNFFSQTDTFAMKLRSSEVELMPHPRPLFEIFVFSPRIEGIHLRSARVARGGIRWSERIDDYRSEVLGLMKTQKVKNVIIVPSGAKGGFIIKQLPRETSQVPAAVEAGYREYIRALLSIADNYSGVEVMHPTGLVVHDQRDPYFVVAADKGTATFSDIANSIAQNEFHFWLEDAFASGGSAGYDHKKYGITAKGGWECVMRHFRDTALDYINRPFSVIGIGDMSGDVFGNGLLLSKQMTLIAAFNHKHVFVDPSPDPRRSFDERLRLFSLPRSQWSDYDQSLISKGGGVFGRFDKEITLSPELRAILSVPPETPSAVDGEQLISLVLKAPVDLLWNGGIGTYVKAINESHSDVNDGTNDNVRINSVELRAKVVGEGGNLGLTQRARIEYSEHGGNINTDAIDNSGGVDLSDHEVNLKLLLNPLIRAATLTIEARNSVLKEIAPEVVSSVLNHNRDQALMLSISREQSKRSIEGYRSLIRDMHRQGFLDRNRDGLPDEAELDDRVAEKVGLYRPELAICGAATKMWIKENIRDSELCKDPHLDRFLIEYFPVAIRERFKDAVLSHPLRLDIVASEVVNSLLPAVGLSFVHGLTSMHGATVAAVMKSILAADRILGADVLRRNLTKLDTVEEASQFLTVWHDMGAALREASAWLLNYHGSSLSLGEMISLYSDSFDTLVEYTGEVFTGQELVRFERRKAQYLQLGVSEADAVSFAVYRRMLPILEVLWSSRQFNQDVRTVAITFSKVLEELGVNTLLKYESILEASNKWEQELITGSFQEIRRSVSLITGQLLVKSIFDLGAIRVAMRGAQGFEAIKSTMNDLDELGRQKRPFQVAVLPVVARQLRLFQI